ncbi:MAG: ATP-binding domain-containing protein, partial [Aggregatilineales bacterium]
AVLLESYGDVREAFLLIKPTVPGQEWEAPDALMYHPEAGVIAIQMFRLSLEDIQRNDDMEILLVQNGRSDINYSHHLDDTAISINAAIHRKRIVDKNQTIPINTFFYFPDIHSSDWTAAGLSDELADRNILFKNDVASSQSLRGRIDYLLQGRDIPGLNIKQLKSLVRLFGDNAIFEDKRDIRDIDKKSGGYYIDVMHNKPKEMSIEQQTLSRIEVGSTPRLVRGVAGSGKSIVLVNQIARYIVRQQNQKEMFEQHPLRIGVVCFNRSLVPMLKRKLEKAYAQYGDGSALPEDIIIVSHFNGLFYNNLPSIKYIPVSVGDSETRSQAYTSQIQDLARNHPHKHDDMLFDIIFVDEGQDFDESDFTVLLELIRPDATTNEKPIIIFYNDAQNLYAKTRPNWKQIGINVTGGRAAIMKECYRNTRQTVEVAFNVMTAKKALSNSGVRTFADINYLKKQNLIEETDDHIYIKFAMRTANQVPIAKRFATREKEKVWVVRMVLKMIVEENVRPEDILILFNKKYAFDNLVDLFNDYDTTRQIEGYIRPYGKSDDKDTYIFRSNHLTISTTHGAKGYDARIVFLMGVDQFKDEPKDRASFYVGATRASLALYLTGLDENNPLMSEAEQAISDLDR